MSNRTAEASKAIQNAWQKEKELVLRGQGTRDWTPEQQKSIIEIGKAYDENGRAFEGHHMKSAEKYSQYQGDADNIQFLTREEHKDAHNGDFKNPTNGYYNPDTKQTKIFGDNNYKPCKIIRLSSPIPKNKKQSEQSCIKTPINQPDSSITVMSPIKNNKNERGMKITHSSINTSIYSQRQNKNQRERQQDETIFTKVVNKAVNFLKQNPEVIFTFGLNIFNILVNSSSSENSGNTSKKKNQSDNTELSQKKYPEQRKRPDEHIRKEHERHLKDGRTIPVREAIVNDKSKNSK